MISSFTVIPRDYINATIGFEALGRAIGTPPKSLMRTFGPRGNPQARNYSPCSATYKCGAGLNWRCERTDVNPQSSTN